METGLGRSLALGLILAWAGCLAVFALTLGLGIIQSLNHEVQPLNHEDWETNLAPGSARPEGPSSVESAQYPWPQTGKTLSSALVVAAPASGPAAALAFATALAAQPATTVPITRPAASRVLGPYTQVSPHSSALPATTPAPLPPPWFIYDYSGQLAMNWPLLLALTPSPTGRVSASVPLTASATIPATATPTPPVPTRTLIASATATATPTSTFSPPRSPSPGGQQPTPTQYQPFVTPSPPTASPTPSAVGSPLPKWTAPQPTARPLRRVNTGSKMGLGVYFRGGEKMLQELARTRPGVVLLMDPDVEFAKEVRKLLPNAFIVGRRYVPFQPLDSPRKRGASFADYVAEKAVPARGAVDAWMSYNEPVPKGDFNGYQAYNQFQVAFAERLQHHYGISAVAGNDGPGAIEPQDYPRHFREAIQASHYFGLHAYGSPSAASLQEPGREWYILRYRKIHEALEAAGIKNVSMVVTETAVVEGWQGRKLVPEQMAADYFWLAEEMKKDPYMIGYAAFGLFADPGRWAGYQIANTKVLDLLATYRP